MSHVLLQPIIHLQYHWLEINLMKTFTSLELGQYHYIRANHGNKTVNKR